MFDLSGIARHLKLNIDQLRTAADLIEQGFSTSFIEKYRGDETNSLPGSVLLRLKYEIDRRKRTEASRQKLAAHLPKDSSPDAELERALAEAHSALAVDVAMRCFRARRMLEQSQERSGNAGKLLEAMLTYSGPPVEDVKAWAASQMGSDQDVDLQLTQVSRLIATLMSSDTSLNNKLRNYIERNAVISVEEVTSPPPASTDDTDAASEGDSSDMPHGPDSETQDSETQDHESLVDNQQLADESLVSKDSPASDVTDDSFASEVSVDLPQSDSGNSDDGSVLVAAPENDKDSGSEALAVEEDSNSGSQPKKKAVPPNSPAKLTPRQRRRRWLQGVLNSMKTLSRPLQKLSAYQQLMLARGVRSHLISTPLTYDLAGLIDISRNAFTDVKHPFSEWFRHAVGLSLEHGLRARIEADALAEMEERASENLLEHATDELRRHLMRRPVRGHTIALIDTVGPKTVCVVFVDPAGKVLACEELPCSVQPEIVNQNVVRLGEWIHRYRVTLVALTNGPARRFMLATLRELMQQSKESGLRWTMADRSGAEAYAGGRIGLRELSIYNRRQRAAIWTARSLQDPLVELLKVDINRMRLGSYQRELPQEAIREQIQETLAACVCARGIDTQNASEFELQLIPGVGADQAKQIVELARTGCLKSRSQMALDVQGWADQDRRHAIGWLRVFGGESALDATLIHPEDYRLAQRLVDHPDFSAPPNAPPGWSKRMLNSDTLPDSNRSTEVATPESTLGDSQQSEDNAHQESMEEMQAVSQSGLESDSDTAATESREGSADLDNSLALEGSAAESPAVEETAEENPDEQNPAGENGEGLNSEGQNSERLGNEEPRAKFPEPEYPEQCLEVRSSEIKIDCDKIANQWQVGRAKLRSVASCLMDPFGDPRLSGVPVPLLSEMPTLENLQPDMCVWAVVVGVADFGAFVELGPNCSGLIHISRLSTQFIEDPHQCVQVGDLLLTWVVSIDRKKNRVALTALSPVQRIQMQEAAEAKRNREEDERQQRNRGFRKDQHQDRSASRGQRYGTTAGASSHQNQTPQGRDGGPGKSYGDNRGQGTGQFGQGNRGQSNRGEGNRGQSNRGEGRQGQGRQAGGGQPGAGRRAAGTNRGSGRDSSGRSAKTVVVNSKKPVAPISQAMKQGEEPLRSFSDLMQFYESKREDPEIVEQIPSELPSMVDSQSVAGEIVSPLDSGDASATPVVIADVSKHTHDSDENKINAEHPDSH